MLRYEYPLSAGLSQKPALVAVTAQIAFFRKLCVLRHYFAHAVGVHFQPANE